MVAELQRTVGVRGALARRRTGRTGGAARRPALPSRAAGLVLMLAALGIVLAVSLGVAAAQRPAEDVNRLIAPAERLIAPAELTNHA
jgi:hypothetical protein